MMMKIYNRGEPNTSYVEYEVLYTFPVMYSGWECDDVGCIVKDPTTGKRHIAMSSHGSWYISNSYELYAKIDEYKSVIKATEIALEVMKE